MILKFKSKDFNFKINLDKDFGKGKYGGQFDNDYWFWNIRKDTDLALFFYHLSKTKIDKAEFLNFIIEKDIYDIIKEDLMKSDFNYVVQGVCGATRLTILKNIIDNVVYDMEEHGNVGKKEIEYFFATIVNEEMYFENILKKYGNIFQKLLKAKIKKMKSPVDLLNFNPDDMILCYIKEIIEADILNVRK